MLKLSVDVSAGLSAPATAVAVVVALSSSYDSKSDIDSGTFGETLVVVVVVAREGSLASVMYAAYGFLSLDGERRGARGLFPSLGRGLHGRLQQFGAGGKKGYYKP